MSKENPDTFLRTLFGKGEPTRNDCGYWNRYNYEDTARIHGWIDEEGAGMCDYPTHCPEYKAGRCPLAKEGQTQ